MKPKLLAFMTYVRFDDEHDNGRLTQFRERLSAEVRVQSGQEFPIFQDRNDINWGENWRERIDDSIDAVTFLIPIITPSFFASSACRTEVEQFLKREKKLKRKDLVLPLYYVDCPVVNQEAKRAKDEIAKAIASHQYADWRLLRFEPFTSPQVGKTLARLAVQIRDALERTAQAAARPPRPAAAKHRRGKRRRATAARRGESAGTPTAQAAESAAESAVAVRGPTERKEPPTHVVDQMYRGDYSTISEAIQAAKPGDRILVRPGLCTEGIILDKPWRSSATEA